MLYVLFVVLLLCSIVIPFAVFSRGARTKARFKRALIQNAAAFLVVFIAAITVMFSNATNIAAAEHNADAAVHTEVATASANDGLKFIAAALATGLGSIGTGIAVSSSASAAIGAISENEGIFGKAIVFVGLAEGISIFGFLISLMILFT